MTKDSPAAQLTASGAGSGMAGMAAAIPIWNLVSRRHIIWAVDFQKNH